MSTIKAEEHPTLIFLHILKTGGSTLNRILLSYFTRANSYSTSPTYLQSDGTVNGFKALPESEKAKIDLLIGHMGYGLHQFLPRPAVYITMLREPIDRVLSNYFADCQLPNSPIYHAFQAGQMDLKAYLRFTNAVAIDNLQTRMISGNWDQRGEGPCTPELLALAKKNLTDSFAVAGLTERFDESYLLMTRAFGWHYALYRKENVTKKRPPVNEVPAEVRQLVQDYNRFDAELYQFAKELLAEKIKQQGLGFHFELRFFQILNALNGLYRKMHQQPAWKFVQKVYGDPVRKLIRKIRMFSAREAIRKRLRRSA